MDEPGVNCTWVILQSSLQYKSSIIFNCLTLPNTGSHTQSARRPTSNTGSSKYGNMCVYMTGEACNMVMWYTHITQVLVAEVKTKKLKTVGENYIFRFCEIFCIVPYGSFLVTIKSVGQHGLVWTLSLAPSSSCLRGVVWMTSAGLRDGNLNTPAGCDCYHSLWQTFRTDFVC